VVSRCYIIPTHAVARGPADAAPVSTCNRTETSWPERK
jgi:hypothetical protein